MEIPTKKMKACVIYVYTDPKQGTICASARSGKTRYGTAVEVHQPVSIAIKCVQNSLRRKNKSKKVYPVVII